MFLYSPESSSACLWSPSIEDRADAMTVSGVSEWACSFAGVSSRVCPAVGSASVRRKASRHVSPSCSSPSNARADARTPVSRSEPSRKVCISAIASFNAVAQSSESGEKWPACGSRAPKKLDSCTGTCFSTRAILSYMARQVCVTYPTNSPVAAVAECHRRASAAAAAPTPSFWLSQMLSNLRSVHRLSNAARSPLLNPTPFQVSNRKNSPQCLAWYSRCSAAMMKGNRCPSSRGRPCWDVPAATRSTVTRRSWGCWLEQGLALMKVVESRVAPWLGA